MLPHVDPEESASHHKRTGFQPRCNHVRTTHHHHTDKVNRVHTLHTQPARTRSLPCTAVDFVGDMVMETKRPDNHAHITYYPLGYAHAWNGMYAGLFSFFVLDGQRWEPKSVRALPANPLGIKCNCPRCSNVCHIPQQQLCGLYHTLC